MNSTHDLEYETMVSGVLSSNSCGAALSRSFLHRHRLRSDCRVGAAGARSASWTCGPRYAAADIFGAMEKGLS